MMKCFSKPIPVSEQKSILQAKLDWLIPSLAPATVIVFGSAASESMTDMSDIDLLLVFPSEKAIKAAKRKLYKDRPKDDWPHDLIFHTTESLRRSVATGGGATYLAMKEGKLLFGAKIDQKTK